MFGRQSRADMEVLKRIGAPGGMDPAWLAEAFDGVSSARADVQRACELVALGYLGACMGADTAMNQRTRDFYKAMNPERGQRTGRWMAHALVDRWPGQPDRSAFRRASTLLAEHFPLPGELCEISRRILADASDGNGEIYPPDVYPDFTFVALAIVLGDERTLALPPFQSPPDPTRELTNAMSFHALWGRLHRLTFSLLDPEGYAAWAAQRR